MTTYEYDAVNRRTAMVDALNHRTEYLYDDYDRLIRTTFHDGTYKTTEYDHAGRKVAETDQESKRTAFTYDSTGNLRTVTDPMGHVTSYAYDANNNRIGQTDANTHTTSMDYDKLNRMVLRTYPNAEHEHFGYDANGNQKFKVDGEGDSTVFTYDVRNRESLRRYSNSGHTVTTKFTFDGKPDTVVDYRGATVYNYNSRGRQASVINPDGSFIRSYYDLQGNRKAEVSPADSVVYGYDQLNRMQTVSASTGTTQYFFDVVGNRDSVANANGTSTGYHYDNLNRLVNVTNWGNGTVISSYSYALNNAGIRTAVTEADGSRVDYGYDASYKLTTETRSGTHPYAISYVYDNVGNRLSQTKDGITTTYSYNSRDQLSTENCQLSTISYTYDHAGRMATKTDAGGTITYSWLDNDRMTSVSGPGVLATYDYDAAGQRVSETTGGGTKKYLVDYQLPYGQVIAETDGSGNPISSYVYGLDRISMTRGASTHTYAADGQGSIRQLTNAAGTVSDEYFYTGFGTQLARTGATVNPFQYTGEAFDANSGFYNLRARLYNPENGRMISVDPYEGNQNSPTSLHRYLYANACPVNYSDPTGRISFGEIMTAVAISGILATNAQCSFVSMVPPRFDVIKDKVNWINGLILAKDFELRITGSKANDRYLVVQWINGYLAVNGVAVSGAYSGGNMYFTNWTVDAPIGRFEYPYLTKSSTNIVLKDRPSIIVSPYDIFAAGVKFDAQLDFMVTVYDKKTVGSQILTQPFNVRPLGFFEWSFHETRYVQ